MQDQTDNLIMDGGLLPSDYEKLSKMADKLIENKGRLRLELAIEEEKWVKGLRGKRTPLPVKRKMLKMLFTHYQAIQDQRVAFGNALGAWAKNGESVSPLAGGYKQLKAYEKHLAENIKRMVVTFPIWKEFFVGAKGCGALTAAALISFVDIHKAHYPSSLVKYCGLGVDKQGRADRKRKNEVSNWNHLLKRRMGILVDSLVRSQGPYYQVYLKEKAKYKEKHPDIVILPTGKMRFYKGHLHLMARRKALKAFLGDLYVAWRGMEGLKVHPQYDDVYMDKIINDKESVIYDRQHENYTDERSALGSTGG